MLAILLLPVLASGQFDGFKNFNVKDGLPGSELYGALQDSKGYMWFIGDHGVSKFNGYTFKNFSTENGLHDNTVVGICEDKKQRIWFSSLSGRLSYYKNDSIHAVGCNDSLEKIFKLTINNSIYVDEGDTIWLGSIKNLMIKIHPGWTAKDLKITLLPKGNYFYTIDKKGIIFGGTGGPGEETITGYTRDHKKTCTIRSGISKKQNEVLRFKIIRLSNGTYLASLGNTLINFTGSAIIGRKTTNGAVLDLIQDAGHSIIVSTVKGAAVFYVKGLTMVRSIPQLQNKVITKACIDFEKELWFTSEGHGVYYIPHKNFKYYTPENGIPDSKISCMAFYHDSSVITGYIDGTISVLKQNSISNYAMPVTNSTGQASRITGISNYKGEMYVSNIEKTYRFNGKALKLMTEIETAGNKKIIKGKTDSSLWILKYSYLLKYDPKHAFALKLKIALKDRVDNIYEAGNGLLWLCATNGVYIYDGAAIKSPGALNSLYKYRPVDITEDLNKNIWIATRGGGVIIKQGNTLKQLTEADGLAGNMCKSILADSNIIWVGTNKGLSKIKRSADGSCSIENIYSKDGLLNNEIGSVIKCNNSIWIAHNNGITVFDPTTVHTGRHSPPVYITGFFVNDSAYALNNRHVLTYYQNHISISYEGLSYKNTGSIIYKYKIKDVDPDWVYTSYTSVQYHNLSAGTYTFEAYAQSSDGVWSKKPASLTFSILPAWWSTWWFIALCVLSGIGFIVVVFRVRLHTVRKAESEKEMLRHRISAAELQALRSQMNPHFVFNAINSVQYFITDNDPESSQIYLEKFASLIRYVLDNAKLAPIPLKTEINALKIYMELEALRFKFDYKIVIKDTAPLDDIYIPSMLVQPYVENAIWHGLMHKKGKGEITITFIINNSDLKCIIDDNGIGRKRSAEIELDAGKVATHKSLGMSITKERLEIINKINQSHLKVTITDKVNSAGESAGTRVEIDIPF